MTSSFKYLVFDTETTGLPPRKTDKIYSMFDRECYPDYEDKEASNHCRLVSISWAVYNINNTTPIFQRYHVIKPDNFIIPEKSTDIHGITTDFALKNGIDIHTMFNELDKDIAEVNLRVAHNFLFDKYIIGSEMYRNYKDDLLDRWDRIPSYCTLVNSMTKFSFGNTKYGYPKPPKLSELYYKLYDKQFEGAHNAYNDTKICAKCYQKLIN